MQTKYDLYVFKNHIKKGGETLAKETLVHVDPERIDQLLKEKRKNKSRMATDLLLSREHLYRQLKKGMLSVEWLKKISEYLDVSEEYLTGESNRITHPSRIKAIFEQFVEQNPDYIPHGVRRQFYLLCLEQFDFDEQILGRVYEVLNREEDYDPQRYIINDALEHIDDYVKMKFNQMIEQLRKEGGQNAKSD